MNQRIATTAPARRCISWCATCFPEIGLCEAAPIPAPGGEIRMCVDSDAETYLSLYVQTETLTVEQAEAIAFAILAMTARARAEAAALSGVAA